MLKKFFPNPSSIDPVKKIAWGGLGSFLMMLMLPKSTKFFIRHWFAGIAKNMVILVIAGLLSQKVANKIIEHDFTPPKRPAE